MNNNLEEILRALQDEGMTGLTGDFPMASPGYDRAGAGLESSLLRMVAPGLNPGQSVAEGNQAGAQNTGLMMKALGSSEGLSFD